MGIDVLALVVSITAVAAAAAAVGAAVQVFKRRSDALAERLLEPTQAEAAWNPVRSTSAPARKKSWGVRALEVVSIIARPGRSEEIARIRARLYCAGFRKEGVVTQFLVTKVALAFGCLGTALLLNSRRVDGQQPTLLIAVVAFAVGFYAPDVIVMSRVRQRKTAIERGLADSLDLLVTCVEAGLGLDAALQRVAGEVRLAYPLLGEELATTFLEVKAGIPRTEAFRRLALRTGVQDLKSLAATLNQTDIFGTSIALALRIQAEGIRTRRMQRAEERAGFVAVKMTVPLVLCILPALVAIVVGPAIASFAKSVPTISRANK